MKDTFTTLRVSYESSGLLTLCLDRPERFNAIGTTMAAELTAFAEGFARQFGPDSRQPCRALLLTATPRVTSSGAIAIAGGDLKELHGLTSEADVAQYSGRLQQFCFFLEDLPLPVVGRLDGGLIGGGAELFLACDLIYASSASYFWFKQHEVGLPTGYGGGFRLAERVGVAQATEWLWHPARLSAKVAHSAGLVQEVLPTAEALDQFIGARAEFWQQLPPALLASQKAMLTASRHPDRRQQLAKEQQLFISQWRNPYHAKQLDGFNQPR